MDTLKLSPSEIKRLENIDDRQINSAAVAQQFISQAKGSHESYWNVIRESEAHLDGKKPKNPEALKKAGLSWSSNYNFHKAKGRIDQGSNENVGEVMRALALSCIEFRRPDEDDSESLYFLQDKVYSEFVATHLCNAFLDMLDGDPRFQDFISRIEYSCFPYGYSPVINESGDDYLGEPTHLLNIAFENRSKVDDIKSWVIFDDIKADKLWRIWRKKKDLAPRLDSDGIGGIQTFVDYWILEGLESVIFHAYSGVIEKDGKSRSPENWTEVLNEFLKDPANAITQTNDVSIGKIWNREINGTYTETYVVTEKCSNTAETSAKSVTASKSGSPSSDGGLLYQRNWPDVKRSSQVLSIIRDSAISADGFIQGLRGIAKYALEDGRRFNRMKNQLQDKLLFAGSPMIAQPSTRSGEKFHIGVHAGFSLMPAGYTFPANQPRFDLQPHILAMQTDEQNYNRETGHFDKTISNKISSRPTTDEIQKTSSEVARADGAKLNIKFSDYSNMLITMIKLIPKVKGDGHPTAKDLVKRFYEDLRWNLKDVFVSDKKDKQNKEIDEIINAVRSFTVEKLAGDIDSLNRSLTMAETPYEINRIERMILLALGHTRREVNRLKPQLFESQTSYHDERVAAVENDMFYRTQEIVYRSTDDPITHLDIHMSKLNRVFEAVKQGEGDAGQAFHYGNNSLQHQQRHIEKLSSNPFFKRKQEKYVTNFRFLLKQLEQIKKIAVQQADAIKRSRESGEQQQGPSAEELAKIQILEWQALKKEERTNFLTESKTRMIEEKFQRDQQREDQKMLAKLQRDKNASDIKSRLKALDSIKDTIRKE